MRRMCAGIFMVGALLAAQAQGAGQSTYRVLPFKSFYEVVDSGLPPKLMVVFEKKCSQTVINILRDDEAEDQKVKINVGLLVKDGDMGLCRGNESITLEAGHTFSGREFEIVPMNVLP